MMDTSFWKAVGKRDTEKNRWTIFKIVAFYGKEGDKIATDESIGLSGLFLL